MGELAELDRPYAEALALVDLEGMSYEEAAGALGIGLDNLKVRLHRARRFFRDRLAQKGILKAEDA